MDLLILKAKNKKDMENIKRELAKNKFKVQSSEDNFILMKKRRYGNTIIQLGVLFLALFFFAPLLIVNVVYFAYSYLIRSPVVLITTETKDKEGENLQFNTNDEVLEIANAML
ncbi:MAG: hypothetical protein HUK28_04800 [Methanobrevibacter sp.]|nr:hypothetical protein [Methanobrevibacter sp.]